MPEFQVSGFSSSGIHATRKIEAVSEAAAIANAAAAGIVVTGARGTGASVRPSARLNPPARTQLYGELGALLDAKLPLADALETMKSAAGGRAMKKAVAVVSDRLAAGEPLSAAVSEIGPGKAEVGTIAAAEARGALGPALIRLGASMAKRQALRKALVGALVYPAVLVAVTLVSICVILFAVVPQLKPLLMSSPGGPSPSAAVLIWLSEALMAHGVQIVAAGMLSAVGLALTLRRPAGRALAENLLLRLPLVGAPLRAGETAAALRVIADLAASGTPLPDAFALAGKAARFLAFRSALGGLAARLRNGAEIAAAFAETPALATGAVGLVAVGARSGQLAPMLSAAADRMERDTEARVARLLALLPPAITLLLGGLVGGVSVVILTAILGANDAAL